MLFGITSKKLWIGALLLTVTLSKTAGAEPVDYSGHVLARIWIESIADYQTLRKVSPDIWTEHIREGEPVFARIPPDRRDHLRTSGLVFEIVNDDLGPSMKKPVN